MKAAERPILPPALAAALARDSGRVRPLYSPWRRTILAAGIAAASGAVVIALHGLRGDHASVSPPLLIASIAARLILGAGLIAVALRDGVPSEGLSSRARVLTAALGIAGLFLLPMLQGGMSTSSHPFDASDSLCYWLVLLAAAPAGILLMVLLGRAYPLRSISSMALGSLGAGYFADVAASLICANGNLAHALLFHAGPVATLAFLGTVAGWFLGRQRTAAEVQV